MDYNDFWDFPGKGWFLQWGVEKESKNHPTAAITVCDSTGPLCGYVPNSWDGSKVTLQAR
jgi:hypothetical protein